MRWTAAAIVLTWLPLTSLVQAQPVARGVTEFAESPTAEQLAFFEKKIRPVLVDQCYSCHSSETAKIKGGLVLDTREGLRKGGDSGASIVPGSPDRSLLVKVVRYNAREESMRMPPKKKLADAVIADIEQWVKMGAPDPREGKVVAKQEIDISKGREFWAFQTPKKVPVPKPKDPTWAKSDTDRFILAALEAKGLRPVADADKSALLRRVYLDLTGLPPTPSEIDAFLNDTSSQPLEKIVDTLLASPRFGERWGRHWLDVARFGESTGKAVNMAYPHAWRYRDYVIAAFNSDKPYDQFIREQLAGDLLPAKNDAEKAEHAIATGFLAIGLKQLNERNRVQFELDNVDEQIDVTTQAFLGLTAACARCHDHKFDPIPTKDYYALAGIFRSTETCYGTLRFIQANHPASLISLPTGSVPAPSLDKLTDKERADMEKRLEDLQKRLKEADMLGRIALSGQISILRGKLDLYDKEGNPKLQAMGVREKFRANNSPVYTRGEVDHPAAVVPRGVLQVVTNNAPTIRKGSGRLELADWIASKENPLAARVMVNRVWLHLFGRGIVPTADNFGVAGQSPSNPQLLDSLALSFMENGWSVKKLIRSLVLSRAYQLSTSTNAKNLEADPDNALLWRMTPSRLDAEVLRDAMLAISGQLDLKAPVGSAVAKAGDGPATGFRFGGVGVRIDPMDTHRSIYMPIVRDNLPESLALFDTADPSLIIAERSNTTVPGQALFLMNNPFVLKQAEAAATRLLATDRAESDRIRVAYRSFFGRDATAKEIDMVEKFLSKSRGKKKDAWAAVCQAMFGSAEFLMRN